MRAIFSGGIFGIQIPTGNTISTQLGRYRGGHKTQLPIQAVEDCCIHKQFAAGWTTATQAYIH